MKTPRSLNGRDLADHLIRHWDYRESHQTGSHIILRTEQPSGRHFLSLRISRYGWVRLRRFFEWLASTNELVEGDLLRDL